MPRCSSCEADAPVTDIKTVGALCGRCLIGVVERRIKKDVRLSHPFKKGERVRVIDDGSTKAGVMLALLGSCLGGLPIKREDRKAAISSIEPKDFEGFSKLLLPLSADDLAKDFLRWLFGKDQPDTKAIPFLACLLDSEVEAYAKAKGISSSPTTPSPLRRDILDFESRYPGLIHGLLKASRGFRQPADAGRGPR